MTIDGEPVVDLWGGDADPAGDPWVEDTIVNVYSSTKTMAALCVLMLADRGAIDLDAPVAEYWPEFARTGKAGVLVRHVMSHSAPACRASIHRSRSTDLYDWDTVCANLGEQAPWWEPGNRRSDITPSPRDSSRVSSSAASTAAPSARSSAKRSPNRSAPTSTSDCPSRHDDRVAEFVPPPDALDDDLAGAAAGFDDRRSIAGRRPTRRDRADARARGAAPRSRPPNGIGNARSIARINSALACGGERRRCPSALARERSIASSRRRSAAPTSSPNSPARFGMGYGLATELTRSPIPYVLLGRLGRFDRPHRSSTTACRSPT